MSKRIFVVMVLAALLVASACELGSAASVPTQLTIQGVLLTSDGNTPSAGDKTFTFRIFDLWSGGTQVWPTPAPMGEEQIVSTDPGGRWTAQVGAVVPLSASVFDGAERWLDITVNDGVNPPETVTRIPIKASPYAYRVATVQGADAGDVVGVMGIRDPGGDDSLLIGPGGMTFHTSGGEVTGPRGVTFVDDVGDSTICITANNSRPSTFIMRGDTGTISVDASGAIDRPRQLLLTTADVERGGYPGHGPTLLMRDSSSSLFEASLSISGLSYTDADDHLCRFGPEGLLMKDPTGDTALFTYIGDNGVSVGINTGHPTEALTVGGAMGIRYRPGPDSAGPGVGVNKALVIAKENADEWGRSVDGDSAGIYFPADDNDFAIMSSKALMDKTEMRISIGDDPDDHILLMPSGNVGISTTVPSERLTVNGMIYSTSGGFRFPDGSIQTTAGGGGGAYWRLDGNSGTTPGTHFLGTTDNRALEIKVNAQRALRIEPDATSPKLIGGYGGNSVSVGAYGATIAGGGSPGASHSVTGMYGTIGGGDSNLVDGRSGTVAGGFINRAWAYAAVGGGFYNSATAEGSFIGSGESNQAMGEKSGILGGRLNYATGFVSAVGGGDHNSADDSAATVAGGSYNISQGAYAAVGGGKYCRARGDYSVVAGGGGPNASDSNYANGLQSTVSGGAVNGAKGTYSTVSGGARNHAFGLAATVGGGVYCRASGDYAVVAGGGGPGAPDSNYASGLQSTVSGGVGNAASGSFAAIGGGVRCAATAPSATVSGGWENTASGQNSFVGSGASNVADGWSGMIPGGVGNRAGGNYTFAAGHRAKANHAGTFVWGDTTNADVTSSAINQFTARTSGGARFYSNSTLTTGVTLAAGGGSWASVSDRNVKANVVPVDGGEVLARLAAIPIARWNYTSQDEAIRHIGPMAQDFYAAFGVGEDDTHITTIDADGVALAAIQALNQKLNEQKSENEELRTRLADLQALVERMMTDKQ